MNVRRPLTAIGAGITAFLVVAVAVIEVLSFEFSAIVGLPIGLVAGIVVAVAILLYHEEAADPLRWILAGLAGFGYGIVATLAASYVNLAETQFETTLAIGVVAGLVAVAIAVIRDRQ